MPSGLLPGQNFPGTSSDVLVFSVDELTGSGISTLVIAGATNASGVQQPLVPVGFAGNVDLALGNAVMISTPQLAVLSAPQLAELMDGTKTFAALTAGTASVGAAAVSISAPYVAIVGSTNQQNPVPLATPSAPSDGVLTIDAQFIDIENKVSLANFSQASFVSSGDIRLSSTNSNLGRRSTPASSTRRAI